MTDTLPPAEAALQLLFKKLHPHLEDAAHALAKGTSKADQERLHGKLMGAREKVVDALAPLIDALDGDDPLAEVLDTLQQNLSPFGETWQESLTLTQLCLEEAPGDLLSFVPADRVATSAWGPRMTAFLERLKDPAYQAQARWAGVDPEIGDSEELDEE